MVGAAAIINLAKDAAQGNIHNWGDAFGSLGTGALQGLAGGAGGAIGGKIAGAAVGKMGKFAGSLGGRMVSGGISGGVGDAVTQFATTGRVDMRGVAMSAGIGSVFGGFYRGGGGRGGGSRGGDADGGSAGPRPPILNQPRGPYIYRTGSRTDGALTDPSGVSFREHVSSSADGRQVFKPGEKIYAVDTRRLPDRSFEYDGDPAGHVSVHGTPDDIRGAVVPHGDDNPLGQLGLRALDEDGSYRLPKK